MKYLLTHWLPPVVLMISIFFFSSLPGPTVQISSTYWSEFTIKKTIHIFEYGLLWLLVYRAVRGKYSNAVIISFVVTTIYAISDEYHQTFTPGRTGTIRDVCIDTVGMSVAYLVMKHKFYPQSFRPLLKSLDIY